MPLTQKVATQPPKRRVTKTGAVAPKSAKKTPDSAPPAAPRIDPTPDHGFDESTEAAHLVVGGGVHPNSPVALKEAATPTSTEPVQPTPDPVPPLPSNVGASRTPPANTPHAYWQRERGVYGTDSNPALPGEVVETEQDSTKLPLPDGTAPPSSDLAAVAAADEPQQYAAVQYDADQRTRPLTLPSVSALSKPHPDAV